MIDTEFWGEPISIYTDTDAIEDGTLFAMADLKVYFNNRIINRATIGAVNAADLMNKIIVQAESNLRLIASNSRFDGSGLDAWGIYQNSDCFDGEKFWLVPNEVDGYTLMLPSEY